MEASPTLRQPLRLSCLKKPPQRLEMFSTTRPWKRDGHRGGHGHRTANHSWHYSQHRGLLTLLEDAWRCSTTARSWNYAQMKLFPYLRRIFLTSMSVWKLNKSIFCQLLPSRAKTFHAWEGDRQFGVTQVALKYFYCIKKKKPFHSLLKEFKISIIPKTGQWKEWLSV